MDLVQFLKPKISPTELNSFSTCPLSWYYGKQKYPCLTTDDSSLMFGRGVHEAIELYYQNISDNPSESSMSAVLEDALTDTCSQLEISSRELEKVIKNFVAFESRRKQISKHYKPTLVEKRIENDKYVCIVDAYFGDIGLAVNWKTGYSSRLYDGHLIQGKIESMVLESNNYPVKRHAFVMLCTGSVFPLPTVTESWVDSERESMINSIKSGLLQKHEGFQCDYCPYILRCQMRGRKLWHTHSM